MRTHQANFASISDLVGEEDLRFRTAAASSLATRTELQISSFIINIHSYTTMTTCSLFLFTLAWVSTTIPSSLAFLPRNAGSFSPLATKSIAKSSTQHFFKSPLVQEALEQCVIDRDVDPDQMMDLLQNLLKVHNLRPNQSFDWYGDLQGSFEFVFSEAIADLPLVGKNLFKGYYHPMREIVHFDIPNQTMGMEVQFLPIPNFPTFTLWESLGMEVQFRPIPNFPTFTLWARDLKWDPEKAQLSYQMDGKDNTSVWKILYADGHVLVAECSVHLGLVVLRRIPPSELEALKEERGHTALITKTED